MSHVNWYRSIEEREQPIEEPRDANDDGRNELDRRDFLKAAGFSLATVAAAGCGRSPVREAIPYTIAPEEIVPGRAYWMATTCHGCPARCGMLVKCRDGRPIKVEGNRDNGMCSPLSVSVNWSSVAASNFSAPIFSAAAAM